MIKRVKGVCGEHQTLLQDTFNISEHVPTEGIKLAPHPVGRRRCQFVVAQKTFVLFIL